MIRSAEEFYRLRTSRNPEEYHIAAWGEASVEVWLEVIQKFPEMREWVAHNKTIPEQIIRLLANDADSSARSMIARKNRTPPDVLDQLSKDSDETVRMAIVHNKKTPKYLLERLLNDPWINIVEDVKIRLQRG